jgi:hypothetical protein
VQKPTQALKSVKGSGNTFDWNPKWSRILPSLKYFSWDINRHPPSIFFFSNIKVDIWRPAVGLRCRNPPRHLSQLKARTVSLTATPSGQELCRPWNIFHGIFIETPLHNFVFKYQSWYLTPYCGLEVQKSTQALQSVKGPGYAFDLIPMWGRTMPSFDIFSWVIYRVPPNPNVKVVYRESSRNISGGAGHCVCGNGSDVTGSDPNQKWRHMKLRDGKWRHNRKYVLHILALFFLP